MAVRGQQAAQSGRVPADAKRSDTVDAVERFGDAFNRHDVDAVMATMTEDCVFESTSPPDGERHVGAGAMRRAWSELLAAEPDATFDTEHVIAAGDWAIVRWTYHWHDGHVRGVDLVRVAQGRVAEKLSYVKG